MAACVHVIATIRAWNKDKDKTAQDREGEGGYIIR